MDKYILLVCTLLLYSCSTIDPAKANQGTQENAESKSEEDYIKKINHSFVWKDAKIPQEYIHYNFERFYKKKVTKNSSIIAYDEARRTDYYSAKKYCSRLSYKGLKNWRLPSVDEVTYSSTQWGEQIKKRMFGSNYLGFYTADVYSDEGRTFGRIVGLDGTGKLHFRRSSVVSNSPFDARCVKSSRENGVEVFPTSRSVFELARRIDDYKRRLLRSPNLPKKPLSPKLLVEPEIKKGEFESTEKYNIRMSDEAKRVELINDENQKKYDIKIDNWNNVVKGIEEKYKHKREMYEKSKHSNLARAIDDAVDIHFGRPVIGLVIYDADKESFDVEIKSSWNDYSSILTIPVPVKHAPKYKKILIKKGFSPSVEMMLVNGDLKIKGITEIQDPTRLVEKSEYAKAKGSIPQLNRFLVAYPHSSYAVNAKKQIASIKFASEKSAYNKAQGSIPSLQGFVRKYSNSTLVSSANSDIAQLKLDEEKRAFDAAYTSSARLEAFMQQYPQTVQITQKDANTRITHLQEQEAIEAAKVKERARLARLQHEKEEREFTRLGSCKVGNSVYHREKWNTTTSSGNILADSLFGAATKEEFIVVYEGVVKGIVGSKVEVVINDYGVKQTMGGGFLQPKTWRKSELNKHADKYLGKTQFYDKSRCD